MTTTSSITSSPVPAKRAWSSYNESLVNRGDISLLIDPELLRPEVWYAGSSGEPHRPFFYSDAAIRFTLTLAEIYNKPLRQAEGLCRGMLKLLGVDLLAPDFSTLCRRRKRLKLRLPKRLPTGARCIAIDSTGFATYEPSAWRRRRGETLKQRRWRKLHLMIDTDSMEVIGVHATSCQGYGSGDSMGVKPLLGQLHEPLIEARLDGAYDKEHVRRELSKRDARVIIPPRVDSVVARHADPRRKHPPWVAERDNDILAIRALGEKLQASEPDKSAWALGLKAWKKAAGYGQRSTIESAIGAIKTSLGKQLRAHTPEGADAELIIRASAYNQLLLIGTSGC